MLNVTLVSESTTHDRHHRRHDEGAEVSTGTIRAGWLQRPVTSTVSLIGGLRDLDADHGIRSSPSGHARPSGTERTCAAQRAACRRNEGAAMSTDLRAALAHRASCCECTVGIRAADEAHGNVPCTASLSHARGVKPSPPPSLH